MAIMGFWGSFFGPKGLEQYLVDYTRFMEQLDAGNISSVTIKGLDVTGEFNKAVSIQLPGKKKTNQVDAEAKTEEILKNNRHTLDCLAEALIKEETQDRNAVGRIIEESKTSGSGPEHLENK